MERELFSLSEVAEMLEVQPHRVTYLFSNRIVHEPKLKVAGRRLWTLPEIAVIAGKLTEQAAEEWDRQRRSHD